MSAVKQWSSGRILEPKIKQKSKLGDKTFNTFKMGPSKNSNYFLTGYQTLKKSSGALQVSVARFPTYFTICVDRPTMPLLTAYWTVTKKYV